MTKTSSTWLALLGVFFTATQSVRVHRKHHTGLVQPIGRQPIPVITHQYDNRIPAVIRHQYSRGPPPVEYKQYLHDYNNQRPQDPIAHVPLTISQMNNQMDDYRLRHHKKPWWLMQGDFGSAEEEGPYSHLKQVAAFMMSLFLGYAGGGRLYVGDWIGYIKLGLCILVCCYPCIMTLSCGKKRGNRRVIAMKDLKSVCG